MSGFPGRAQEWGHSAAQSSDSYHTDGMAGWHMRAMLSTPGRGHAVGMAKVARPQLSGGFSVLPSDPATSPACPSLSQKPLLLSPPSPPFLSALLTPDPPADLTADISPSHDERVPILPPASLPAPGVQLHTPASCVPGHPLQYLFLPSRPCRLVPILHSFPPVHKDETTPLLTRTHQALHPLQLPPMSSLPFK